MGMFDYLIDEDTDWEGQTKDLSQTMSRYFIRDGRLFLEMEHVVTEPHHFTDDDRGNQ